MMSEIFSDAQLRDKNIDALKRLLRRKLRGYGKAVSYITTGNLLYRGVPWPHRPSTIDQVSYPPACKTDKLGRVNRIGKSVFYASRGAAAVFYELRAKEGEFIALSEWELTAPLWMHHLGYHPDALHRMGAPNVAFRPRLTNPLPNETKRNAKLSKQLSLAFTEDIHEGREYRYKQSIAINELLFDGASPIPRRWNGPKANRVAGTVYPAMRMRGAADNVAIWPEFVDSNLRIKSVRYVLVEAADEVKSSYTFLTVAISNTFFDRDIVWQNDLPPEIQRRSHIALEGDRWIIRNGSNEIYDTH